MKRCAIIASLMIGLLGATAPVAAEVEVEPIKRKPSIRLDGHRVKRPAPKPIRIGHPAEPGRDTSKPMVFCKVDPDSNTYGCRRQAPGDDAPDAAPQITEGDVLRAARTIGLPSLQVRVQPGDKTLVNIPTIFHAEPRPFERSVTLLGFQVDLTAIPINFGWSHGDGTSQDTSGPGRPYPAMDVTHRYTRPADNIKARVDVTYRVRYRIDGSDWQTLRETLTASGPVAQLDVAEAAPVLTKP